MGSQPDDSQSGGNTTSDAPLEIFATGDTMLAEPHSGDVDERVRRAVDNVQRGREAVRTAYHVTRDIQAASGNRPGVYATDRPRSQGRPSDIMHPVLVNHRVVVNMANSGELFARPLPRLQLSPAAQAPAGLTWTGELRRGIFRRRVPVTFQIRPSPSMVVTVLELVPQQVQRWTTRSFLRAGIRAIDEVALRLERSAATE